MSADVVVEESPNTPLTQRYYHVRSPAVIRLHVSCAAENTFDLPREARKWSDSDPNQMEEGILCGVYCASR